MIRLLKKQPERIDIFKGLCRHAIYFENYDDAGPYAYVGFEIYADKANLHMHILRWNHNVAKKLKEDWDIHVLMLLKLGVTHLVAVNQDAEDKCWHKFISLFGFGKPILAQLSQLIIYYEDGETLDVRLDGDGSKKMNSINN